jgi:Uma2 family endonuclease
MALPAPKYEDVYTYADYLSWPEGERWELLDGIPYNMSPAPFRQHQGVAGELFRQIANFLSDKPCEVYAAPFDVRLLPEASQEELRKTDNDELTTVVQPDISVICDADKLDERGCLGAPDLIIEVLSPSTAAKDQIQKLALYEKCGVKEYWIVHPTDKVVTVRLLNEEGKYGIPTIYEGKGTLSMRTLEGLEIDLDLVFRE